MKIRMMFRSRKCDRLFPIDWNAEPHHVGARIDQYVRALSTHRLVRIERLGYPYDIPSATPVESLIAAKRSLS